MLADRTVLVSGGTGAIGSAICRAAAREGARVAFSYRKDAEGARALAAELEAMGRPCLTRQVDGCDAAAIAALVAEAEQRLDGVHVLVNNLGAAQVLPFALIEESDWDEMMAVNLKSMFLFSKAAVRGMIRRRSGAVVNLGSIAGSRLLEVPVHYATAKAGVVGFTTSLAKELCRYGIRVNAVVPGLIDGGIGENASARQLEDYERFCALGRRGTPAEVAEIVVFLASERAAYVNAQCLTVDGGL